MFPWLPRFPHSVFTSLCLTFPSLYYFFCSAFLLFSPLEKIREIPETPPRKRQEYSPASVSPLPQF